MFNFFRKLFAGKPAESSGNLNPESAIVVSFDAVEVKCEKPNGNIERIAWKGLDAVVIETNDQGPFAPDVIWLLLSKNMESGCVFPQGATGEESLLVEMQRRLPNFNYEMLIAAMTSVENQKFLVWERNT